jgi:hypothetical protein
MRADVCQNQAGEERLERVRQLATFWEEIAGRVFVETALDHRHEDQAEIMSVEISEGTRRIEITIAQAG